MSAPSHAERQRRYYWRHHDEIAARLREPDYLARHRAYKAAERARHGVRIAARNALNHAIGRGEVERGACAECGSGGAQGHHHRGYEPTFHLDVIWLCPAHHGERHRLVAA